MSQHAVHSWHAACTAFLPVSLLSPSTLLLGGFLPAHRVLKLVCQRQSTLSTEKARYGNGIRKMRFLSLKKKVQWFQQRERQLMFLECYFLSHTDLGKLKSGSHFIFPQRICFIKVSSSVTFSHVINKQASKPKKLEGKEDKRNPEKKLLSPILSSHCRKSTPLQRSMSFFSRIHCTNTVPIRVMGQ